MTTPEEAKQSGPGISSALVAFAIFLGIGALSVSVAHRSGTLYDDARTTGRVSESSDGGKIELAAVMSHVAHRNQSQVFRRAEMVTVAGSSVLDLSGAHMQSESGSLEVVVIGGSAFVKVPPGWAVVAKNTQAIGEIDNQARKPEGEPSGKLRLEAFILGGRLQVTH